MDVPVQPRMVHEDLQAAADEQNQKQEIDVVSDAQPWRKTVRHRSRFGTAVGVGRYYRQTDRGPLNVRCGYQQDKGRKKRQQCLEADTHIRTLLLIRV